MDLAIRNADIVDGAGGPRFRGDLGISDGVIVAVGDVPGRARTELDARGAVAAPGFIDVHTHYDAQVLWDQLVSPSIFHGVTSVMAGHCGFTLAPLSGKDDDLDYLLRMLARVEGMPLSTLRSVVKPTWKTFGEYLARIDGKLAINTLFLVGHSTLRRAVMGESAVERAATEAEVDAMCALLAQSLREGGAGFSTTVSTSHNDYEGRPVPSRWASRDEILRLARTLKDFPGTWIELVLGKFPLTEEEYAFMTELGLAAGKPVNWNLVLVSSKDRKNFESQRMASDYAKARGAQVYGLIPAAAPKAVLNFISGFILDVLPGWNDVLMLPHEQKVAALADAQVRRRLRDAPLETENAIMRDLFSDWGAQTIEAVTSPENQKWVGKPVRDYAAAIGREPFDALVELAIAEDLKMSFAHPAIGDDPDSWTMRAAAWRDERFIVGGSDAGAHLDMLNTFAISTQLLGEGVRDRGLLGLEEAVRLLTGVPAERFGLVDRGLLKPGMAADIVLFDPNAIACGPISMQFDLPQNGGRLWAAAEGVRGVFVNGVQVVRDGEPTGALGGRVLRSGKDTQSPSRLN